MSFIAIEEENQNLAGVITYFSLTSGVEGDLLNQALSDAGFRESTHIGLPTPRKALTRTLEAASGHNIFRRNSRDGSPGSYLVRQEPNEEDGLPNFTVLVRALVNSTGNPEFSPVDDEGKGMAEEMRKDFWTHISDVTSTDISSWLIHEAYKLDAIALRDHGGVYFIPRDFVGAWKKLVKVLEEQTVCRVHMIPSMKAEDTLDAIVDSLIDQAERFTEKLEEDLSNDELGERALEGRGRESQGWLEKVARYEQLLGGVASRKLEKIKEELELQKFNAIQLALSKGGK